jgi:hypothetical protein
MGKPVNPATTPSLPGANSTRTDGGIASKQAQRYISGMPNYGDGQQVMDIQGGAPMAAAPATPTLPLTSSAGDGQTVQPPVTSLTAQSERPFEPVTAGAAAGPGAGPEALNLGAPDITQYQTVKEGLQAYASHPDASPAAKFLAQRVNQVF